MKRRNFLRNVTVSAAAIPTLSLLPGITTTHAPEEPETKDFLLQEMTISDLQQKMQSGAWTAEFISKQYLAHIAAIDKNGPKINSVIELNPDALKIARDMDLERKAGKVRGPMHGIPVLIKDNIDTGDKMMTTAGALALEGNYAAKDAFIIEQLRHSGAVLLGKTNLSEWANFRSTRSVSGWSSRGGQTRNPYLLDRSPCGSSAGSGAAVAANLCAVAIGTETNGSIACPSSINGIVGIKPTVGLLSRAGIIPISKTQDTAGPMARTVRDAAILLSALTGIDPQDAVTAESENKAFTDYSGFLDVNGLQGKRIGVEKSFLKGHEGVTALFQEALETLKQKGATLVEVELEAKMKDLGDAEYTVLCYEFKDGIDQYLRNARAKVKNLQAVIDFNLQHEATAMPWFKQEILDTCVQKGDLQTKEYLEALQKLLKTTRNAIDGFLQENKLDAIVGPANGPSWCIDFINGDYSTGYGAYSSAAMAGYPTITVPMGMVHELPIGLSFTGPAYGEPTLITLAYAYEQASKKRVVPHFKK